MASVDKNTTGPTVCLMPAEITKHMGCLPNQIPNDAIQTLGDPMFICAATRVIDFSRKENVWCYVNLNNLYEILRNQMGSKNFPKVRKAIEEMIRQNLMIVHKTSETAEFVGLATRFPEVVGIQQN